MLSKVLSSAVIGIDAYSVEVEVDITRGLPRFNIVGLPETAVKESRERVKAAIKNSGYELPDDHITVNLAPAHIKKEGTGFDLPIALGILGATRILARESLDACLCLGELSLDGRIKPVFGSLPAAIAARDAGHKAIVVPYENRKEAAVVEGISLILRTTCPRWLNSSEANWPFKQKRSISPGLLRATPPLRKTSPMSRGRSTPSGQWKLPPPGATTC